MGTATRDHKLDVAKGVLISLVVWGHLIEKSGGPTVTSAFADGFGSGFSGWEAEPQRSVMLGLNLFVMSLFVLLVGITSRAATAWHRTVQMATLLVVAQVFYLSLDYAAGDGLADAWFNPYYALWFLLAMVWWAPTVPFIERHPRVALVLSLVLAIGAGVVPIDGWYGAWARTAQFWVFLVVGRLYGKQILRMTSRVPTWVRLLAVPVPFVGTWIYVVTDLNPAWTRANESFAEAGVSIVDGMAGRVAALLVTVVVSAAVLVLIPAASSWLEVVGRRSLPIYVLHVSGVAAAEVFYDRFHHTIGNVAAVALTFPAAAIGVALLAGLPIFDRTVRAIGDSVASRVAPIRRPAPQSGQSAQSPQSGQSAQSGRAAAPPVLASATAPAQTAQSSSFQKPSKT